MPWELAADTRLNSRDYRVLIALRSFRARSTGLFFATREQIAERCGILPSNISATTTRLVKLGYLVKHGGGGRGKAVRYEFRVPETVSPADTVSDEKKGIGVETVSTCETVSKPANKGYRRGIHAETLPDTHEIYPAHERPADERAPQRSDVSQAVALSMALRAHGLPSNPSHPEIVAAAAEGVTSDELSGVAEAYPDKPWIYAVKVARTQHQQKASTITGAARENCHRGRKSSAVERTESALQDFLAEHGA